MAVARSIRIEGNVVLRPRKPWTPTVQLLLAHLHQKGLPVPEPLGYDDHLERVSLVEGEAGEAAEQHHQALSGVRTAGALLRLIHDATVDWRPPPWAQWSVPYEAGQIICHGDPQPANFAWRDGRAVGLFDWDAARPGLPMSDVAYGLTWFTPTTGPIKGPDPNGDLYRRRARAGAFLEGYGWSGSVDVAKVSAVRRAQAIDEVVWLGEQGHEPHATWVAAGWPERWRQQLDTMLGLDLVVRRPCT